MANRLPILAVDRGRAFCSCSTPRSSWSTRASRRSCCGFGEIVDVKNEPGIYFKAPFAFFDADSVQLIENRVLRFDLDNIRVQVSGGKFYEVDAFIAYRISDPRVFRSRRAPVRSHWPKLGCGRVSMRRCAVSTVCAILRRHSRKSGP